MTGEKNFNGDHFETEGNQDLNNDEKTLLWVFWQIYNPWFYP